MKIQSTLLIRFTPKAQQPVSSAFKALGPKVGKWGQSSEESAFEQIGTRSDQTKREAATQVPKPVVK
jgi:hypothetical protein